MTLQNAIVRSLIRLLWGRYPNQVRDILNEQRIHVHKNPPTKQEKARKEMGKMVVGSSHTARMAGGAE